LFVSEVESREGARRASSCKEAHVAPEEGLGELGTLI
jgi:hypothetical protein